MSKRMRAAAGAVVTVGIGMLLRGAPGVGDALGSVAYTTLVALVIVTLRPATTPVVAGLSAFLASFAVELAQLTPLPGAIVARVPAARWVLGSTFNASDVWWYGVGALVALAVCRMLDANSGR